jgi:hypothetical protein
MELNCPLRKEVNYIKIDSKGFYYSHMLPAWLSKEITSERCVEVIYGSIMVVATTTGLFLGPHLHPNPETGDKLSKIIGAMLSFSAGKTIARTLCYQITPHNEIITVHQCTSPEELAKEGFIAEDFLKDQTSSTNYNERNEHLRQTYYNYVHDEEGRIIDQQFCYLYEGLGEKEQLYHCYKYNSNFKLNTQYHHYRPIYNEHALQGQDYDNDTPLDLAGQNNYHH